MNNKQAQAFKRTNTLISRLIIGFTLAIGAHEAWSQDYALIGQGTDIKDLCGQKPMTIGLADGYGGNTWRRIALAELKEELDACDNIKKLIYTNADGNRQKANLDINSMVAQGVNVLIVFPDFGDSQLPALRKATRAGTIVVPYLAKLDRGVAGRHFSANVHQDINRIADAWADWIGQKMTTGNLVFMGGTAGAKSSQSFLEGLKMSLDKYPGLKLLDDQFVVSNWNPVDSQKAASGLIAKYPKIDAVVTDYGVSALGVIKAFEQAGLAVPAIATIASNNELNCKYLNMQTQGKGFEYYSLDGTTSLVRFAVRRGIAEFQNKHNPEALTVMPFVYADSTQGLEPECNPSAPPDADLSSTLSSEALEAVFND